MDDSTPIIGHISIQWETIPLPASLIFHPSLLPETIGICATAFAIGLRDPKAQQFGTLVQLTTDHLNQRLKEYGGDYEEYGVDAVRDALIRGFALPRQSMKATLKTDQPKVVYGAVRQKKSDRFVEMTAEAANNLAKHFPGIDVALQFRTANKWYSQRSLRLTTDKFLQWCNRIKPANASTSISRTVANCVTCAGRGTIVNVSAGEITTSKCHDCQVTA